MQKKHNIKFWEEDGVHYAEWADRALDDDDRYKDDSIIIIGKGNSRKAAYARLCELHTKWNIETRGK